MGIPIVVLAMLSSIACGIRPARPPDGEVVYAGEQYLACVGPDCVADFCFADRLQSDADLVAAYGAGFTDSREYRCYESQDGLFIQFEMRHDGSGLIDSIFISTVPNCPGALRPTRPFQPLLTREGIGVGSSEEEVRAAYGKPCRIEPGTGLDMIGLPYDEAMRTAPFGDTALVYSDTSSLLSAAFYMQHHVVTAFSVSASE